MDHAGDGETCLEEATVLGVYRGKSSIKLSSMRGNERKSEAATELEAENAVIDNNKRRKSRRMCLVTAA